MQGLSTKAANNLASDITDQLHIEESLFSTEKITMKSILTHPKLLKNFMEAKLLADNELLLEIGIESSGDSQRLTQNDFDSIFQNIRSVVEGFGAVATIVNMASVLSQTIETRSVFVTGHVLIRKQPKTIEEIDEVRVCVAGNVDAGKV